MPPIDQTPLAPSVEKAYYRKCIQLKRRLNEVEAANDESKLRRARLDRAIMKMRLERAFLLDELRKRMDHNTGSEGSADEAMATPPADRPHRDKRRRQHTSTGPAQQPAAPPANSMQTTPTAQRTALEPNATDSGHAVAGTDGQMAPPGYATEEGRGTWNHSQRPPSDQSPALPHASPYGPPAAGPAAHVNGVTGEPMVVVEGNGERLIHPANSMGAAFGAVSS